MSTQNSTQSRTLTRDEEKGKATCSKGSSDAETFTSNTLAFACVVELFVSFMMNYQSPETGKNTYIDKLVSQELHMCNTGPLYGCQHLAYCLVPFAAATHCKQGEQEA